MKHTNANIPLQNLSDTSLREFISTYGKLHKSSPSDTISRGIKEKQGMMHGLHKQYSNWSALSSRAVKNGVSTKDIFKRDCWKNKNTLAKFYSKDIIKVANNRDDFC